MPVDSVEKSYMFDNVRRAEVRGHCLANLDPLGITRVRLGAEDDVRSKLLATYKYHELYNLGKSPMTS